MDASTVSLGFTHFIAGSDFLGKSLLVLLLGMSVTSWALITLKGVARWRRERNSREFLCLFRDTGSLGAVQAEIGAQGIRCPFSHLTAHALDAQEHYSRYSPPERAEAETRQAFLVRTMKSVIDEDARLLENGLPVLATIASTAPFIGLFGTVWGIYHALIAVSAGGAGTLEKVAGPVGEALIMTGIGLAVAIPAVIGYNWLVRGNSVTLSRLDAFANELLTFLSTGKAYAVMQQANSRDSRKHAVYPAR
ncbi:MAG: MotA/TolQ/ExbB proton channel family protein [Oxalobacter sp.]|nr:MotA/TolQ/ExbB proton channel family protein [Oxalobacter sp.]